MRLGKFSTFNGKAWGLNADNSNMGGTLNHPCGLPILSFTCAAYSVMDDYMMATTLWLPVGGIMIQNLYYWCYVCGAGFKYTKGLLS